MKTKLLAVALIAATLGVIAYYPLLDARGAGTDPVGHAGLQVDRPVVDVVFVLDTTGSMSGLIQTAKDKIWSIAKTMASAQPTPEIRIGLVAYRDRGDDYVTRVVDLTSDLDSVHAALMDFRADGGGDTPESVNRALHDAVHRISWSQAERAYQVIFLVGDAPPHMDYPDEEKYPAIVAEAQRRGIVVNTVQCGDMSGTVEPWTRIASLGQGDFFRVEQTGGAVAYTTPFDEEIATLSAKLDQTRLYYGSGDVRRRMEAKVAATEKLHEEASIASLARRGAFNAGDAGEANFLGVNELVDAVAKGEIAVADIDKDELPEALKPLTSAEREAEVERLATERADLSARIQSLAEEREAYIQKQVADDGGAADSLDQQLFETVTRQGASAGLEYEAAAPSY